MPTNAYAYLDSDGSLIFENCSVTFGDRDDAIVSIAPTSLQYGTLGILLDNEVTLKITAVCGTVRLEAIGYGRAPILTDLYAELRGLTEAGDAKRVLPKFATFQPDIVVGLSKGDGGVHVEVQASDPHFPEGRRTALNEPNDGAAASFHGRVPLGLGAITKAREQFEFLLRLIDSFRLK